MSADDFQTKYTSFMEGIVKGTVAETTKLFETMVDELKAELSKVKMENEVLKTTRRGKENCQTSSISESCQSEGPEMRDTAVQCDLLPGPPLLGTLDHPMGLSSGYQQEAWHQEWHQEEESFTLLLEHDDDDDDVHEGHSQLEKPEVCEPTVVSKEVSCAVADSAAKETEDAQPEQQHSSGVPRRSHKSPVSTLHDCNSHETHARSVESLATISDKMEAASGACPTTLGAARVPSPQPTSGERAGSEPARVAMQQCSGVPLLQQQQVDVTAKKNRKESSKTVKRLQKTLRKTATVSPSNAGGGHYEAKTCTSVGDGDASSEMCLRSSASKDISTPLKTTPPPGSRKRRISTQDVDASSQKSPRNEPHRDGSAHKKTQSSRTRFSGDDAASKRSRVPSITHKESTFMRVRARSKRPCSQSLSSSKFAEEEHTSKHLKRPSRSLLGNTAPPATHWVKLPEMATKPGETAVKKSRPKPHFSISENVKLRNGQKLAKAKPVAKRSTSKQSKLNKRNSASDEMEKKCTPQAVSTQAPAREATLLRKTRSSFSPVQKETRSPRSQNHAMDFPPSPPQHLPIGSLLQPLPVTGGPLLKNQCGECGRVLSSSAALESHLSLHKGHRPFSCTVCRKSFPDAKGLRRHDRVHRNGRIHTCQQCGKGFVYVYGLTKHLQMVHVKFKPFVCQICNKSFFTKVDVEDHIRLHTGEKPFHCHLCEKKFVKKVELKVHLKWHNGEKRHWCPYCGKGFFDYNNWKRHKYIHTGEKPHSCPHCAKHFKQSSHLKKHVRNVHKIQ
ncbi:zinc finger protein 37-like [Dunckerocampus dactyliophorus]|uniref:zinc finger protein 37-like n=1 Tax=Dunckerocampus dactyliophorus TaxID=161453 RepID=UPI00240758D5|nr:zinc finger protein 37-like [Dunckerocampus dactyliophorus]